jgi:hypothetical protein
MSSKNPQTYYEDPANHGGYVYESLEMMVNNFMQNYTGNASLLGPIKRYNVLFWMKKGIQMFTSDALKEVKAVELELGDTLDIKMPPDYVDYVRVSWLNERTGDLMPMSNNNKLPLATAYLQDHKANILFDENGYILEGDSATNNINDDLTKLDQNQKDGILRAYCEIFGDTYQNFRIDTSINYNGYFEESKRQGRIHFDSSVQSKIIVLEYVSDGLEYLNESDIKVNKYAEYALYNWTNWNLLNNKNGVPLYEKNRAKRDFDTAYRNAKIRLMNIKIAEISQLIKKRNTWIH